MNSEIRRQILASWGDTTRLVAVHSPRPVAWQCHYKNAPYHLSILLFSEGQAGEEWEPSNRADFRSGYEGVSTCDPMPTFRRNAATSLRRILLLSPLQASHPTRTQSQTLRTAGQNWTQPADVLFVFIKLHAQTTLNCTESPSHNSAGTVQLKGWSAGRSSYKYINTRRIYRRRSRRYVWIPRPFRVFRKSLHKS
jgi:hypothetical protein